MELKFTFKKTLIVLGLFILIFVLNGCTLKYKPQVMNKEHYNLLLEEKLEVCRLSDENIDKINYINLVDDLMLSAEQMDLFIYGINTDYEYVYEIPPDIKLRLIEDIENLYCYNKDE